MKKKTITMFFFLALSFLMISCSPSDNLVVLHQVTGPIQTNCYLLYDVKSKEAALFDVGGPIDTLVSKINENNLGLKYVFITHCHPDHIQGLPIIEKSYPKAKVCFSREEYEDMKLYSQWESRLDPKDVAEMKKEMEKNPELAEMMNLDMDLA